MELFQTTLKSGLPLITCRTNDTLNLEDVLQYYSSQTVMRWQPKMHSHTTLPKNTLLYGFATEVPSIINKDLYVRLVTNESTLLMVNIENTCTEAFNVGEIPTPKKLIIDMLNSIMPEDDVNKIVKYTSGLSIKQVVEVIRLCQAHFDSITPRNVIQMRAMVIGHPQGLEQVHGLNPMFLPSHELKQWTDINKEYFLNCTDLRLVPRGILMDGNPGVGKTEGAKYLASEWGVSLYRLDLSSSLGKYVGESEARLSKILESVNQEQPCILLIDEVEKIFKSQDDSGVTSRLLAQLLWWLQEHQSRVLTVMTTNDVTSLPPELYRAGRIDKVLKVAELAKSEAFAFAGHIFKTFINNKYPKNSEEALHPAKLKVWDSLDALPIEGTIAHVNVIKLVTEEIKNVGLYITKEIEK